LVSPEYSARKHHVPTAFGVNDGDTAVAVFPACGVTDTAEPTGVPPMEQPGALVKGPHAKKLTIPVGLPPVALPLTVAWSVFEVPMVTVAEVGALVVPAFAGVTVKHSALLPSEDGV
jgi:hypothetical protein